jgi:uncharacterized protein
VNLRAILCVSSVVCLLNAPRLRAQSQLFIRTFVTNDSASGTLLRWAPATPEAWRLGIKNGYIIERYTANEYLDLAGQDLDGKGTLLTDAPVMPLPKNDTAWPRLQKENQLNAFLFEAMFTVSKTADPKRKAQEEQLKFGMAVKAADLSIETAKAEGLYFEDKDRKPGEVYFYRVRIAGSPDKKYAAVSSADKKPGVLHAPETLSGDFRNKRATLAFDAASTRSEYAGYIIERSDDSIHFSRVNKTLFVFAVSQFERDKTQAVYLDSFPQNEKTYWYRVRGYSYFGFSGPASNTIRGKGKEDWNIFPVMDTLYSPDNKSAVMKWHLPDDSARKNLKTCIVLRGTSAGGPFVKISDDLAGINKSAFTDPIPAFTNYYMICAVSIYHDTGFSFPALLQLQDNDPPPVPQAIKGVVDTNGIVHLSWKNADAPDLKGYRVFRCNSLREEYYEVSDSILADAFFTDSITLHTLTREVFYFVKSVDRMYNNSEASLPCRLKRPDKIAPEAAVALSAVHTDSTVLLRWINSGSDDVMCIELKRNGTVIGSWIKADTIGFFTDKFVRPGNLYLYTITVTDSSGNSSVTNFPHVKYQPRVYPALPRFNAIADHEARAIALSWEAPAEEVDRYIIYKAKKGESFRAWKTVNGNTLALTDKELYPGNIYEYRVKAILKNGCETKLSGIVEVEY